MKKRVSILLAMFSAVFLVCAMLASAALIAPSDVKITVDPVKNQITDLQKGYGEFKISVENKGDVAETFKLMYLEPPTWFAQVLPGPSANTIRLAPGETGQFHVLVKPNKLEPGSIGLRALIQAVDAKIIYDDAVLRVNVVAQEVPEVPPDPDFEVEVSVPAQMDPHGTYNVLVHITNKNSRVLEDVSIKLNSNLLTEETTATVSGDETKTVSFAVLMMDNDKPQKDQLQVKVTYEDETYYDASHNFEVVEYLPPFQTDISVEKKWLKQVRTLKVTNTGNTQKTDSLRLQTSLKEKFFSRSEPKYEFLKEEGRYYFTWPVTLEAEESTEIILTTSYRWLLLVALAIIALLVYKIAMANPLIVKKKIKTMNKAQGAISDMTVVLYLKNRGKETITNLRVVERVSRMVQLKSDSFAGSMHPVKMHPHDREGTLLEYRFSELTPGDTRIITYKVHSKLHIFGTITIKPTVVEFTNKKGQKKKSSSNSISAQTEETKAPAHKEHKEHHKAHHEHAHHKEHHGHKHK
ncbi:hypothetical protein KY362_04690 [Candidatus Woesearchaeota archaeon]|nr:hypothetical protein [Candidatus Woesearchaeota archaeon]